MRPGPAAILALALPVAAWAAAPAVAQSPLSAIEWLRDQPVPQPEGQLPLTPPRNGNETGEDAPGITSHPLDAPRRESVGLYPAGRVGLVPTIWGPSTVDDLTGLIRILPVDMLPALRDLTYRLLLAEFDAPRPGRQPLDTGAEAFVLARVDALIGFGALDQAGALLDTLEPLSPALLMRRFDIRLLLGEDETACTDLDRAGRIGPMDVAVDPSAASGLEAAAIFCLARSGDWTGAEARLADAVAQGALPPFYLDLLDRFLDDGVHAEADTPATDLPARPSPLAWRLLEALGEPVITQGLPVAFAHADLRGTAGWRAQIEAAERLVRSGALPPNRLLGLYTERRAAASGGIWERVRRVQQLDAALGAADPAAIGAALLAAWPQFQDAELETAFAGLFATQLMAAGLQGPARDLALTVGLLSADYELAALAIDPATVSPRLARLAAIARGLPVTGASPTAANAEALVLAVFAESESLPEPTARRMAEGRVGEELLRVLIRAGASSDPRMLGEGLSVLRHLGLEDIARRTALQALMLERRG